jgi:uncharacterized protein YecE (DUF72 family)
VDWVRCRLGASLISDAIEAVPKLSSLVRLGTSSWTFPGWNNLVYFDKYKSGAAFTRDSLGEYGRCPMFRAVGVDSTYYRPPTRAVLDRLHGQAPHLHFVVKAWQEITSYRYPENFLNAAVFKEAIVQQFSGSALAQADSTLLLQFSRMPEPMITSGEFLSRLERCLEQVPETVRAGVEVRNATLLSREYVNLLTKFRVRHVYSWSTEMPELVDQLKLTAAAGGLSNDEYIVRALIPPGFDYETLKENYAPFNQERRRSPELHRDLQRVIKRGLETERKVTVLFNNKAEGSAPLSVARLILATIS